MLPAPRTLSEHQTNTTMLLRCDRHVFLALESFFFFFFFTVIVVVLRFSLFDDVSPRLNLDSLTPEAVKVTTGVFYHCGVL